MTSFSEEEKNWTYNEIKRETSVRKDRKTEKVLSYGISPKDLEDWAIKGRKPHGNATGIPGRDKVRIIVKRLIEEGRVEYVKSKGRKPSALIALNLDQRMQNDRTLLYAAYLRLLGDIEKIGTKAITRAFNEKDFFEYVRIKNELSSFPLIVYYAGLKSSEHVKSELADDLLDQIKKKISELKKVEKFQNRRYTNFKQIIQGIENLSKLQYELYGLFSQGKDKKIRKRFESIIRSQRNEVEFFIKEGKLNHAN